MNDSIRHKVFGTLFGYAIGDALGLGTEFMSRREVANRYPEGLHDYSQIFRDAHRSQWERGEFSNDTETVAIVVESIADKNGIDTLDMAARLKEWYYTDPIDLTTNLRGVLSQPDFTARPLESTRKVWNTIKDFDTTSECLGRALFTGLWNENLEQNVLDVCRLTHPHSRCEASSLIIAEMANSLFWKDEEVPYERLIEIANQYNPDVIKYVEMAKNGKLSDFEPDDENSYWYVRKTMGIALWALWHCKSSLEALETIVAEGGDADTNASLATALVVLRHGIDENKEHWPHGLLGKDRLTRIAEKFTATLTKKFAPKK